jgi:hypothetical protein
MVMLVLVGVLLVGERGPSPEPTPDPSPAVISEDVVAEIVVAERNLAVYEAEIAEQLAAAVLDGRVKDSKQFYAMAAAATQKAEDKAFANLNALNNKYLSREKWDPNLAAEFQRLKAKGKREVASR